MTSRSGCAVARPRARSALALARLSVALLGLAALLVVGAAPASAVSGVWGAGQYPYLDGQICQQSGGTTTPLASWDFGTGAPAFLVAPVTTNGLQDSAALPFASVGQQTVTPVTPGMDGFSSGADIATYAALLSRYGSGSTEQVAEVADAMMTKGGSVTSCVGDPSPLLASVAANAGPYTVKLATGPAPNALGQPQSLVATVTGGSGRPVGGMSVTFTATNAVLTNTTVTTSGDGTATTQFTAFGGGTTTNESFTASVTASTGLDEVRVQAVSSFSNPSGSAVPAVFLGQPVTSTGSTSVSYNPTASPILQPGGGTSGLGLGGSFVPATTLTGMNGHSGDVTLNVYGPVAPDATGSCANAAFSTSSPLATTSGIIPAVGDGSVHGTPWTPTTAGCYLVSASITTTDAIPNVTVNSSFAAAGARLVVVGADAALTVGTGVLGAGPLTAQVAPAKLGPFTGSITAQLSGPMPPAADGSCTTVDWSHAPHAITVSSAPIKGATPQTVTSAAVKAGGCYQWQPRLLLNVPGTGQIAVLVPSASKTVLVLTPVVTVSVDQSWAASPAPVPVHVSLVGTYGQAAHLSILMQYVPAPADGCALATFAKATTTAPGPTVAVPGTASVVSALTGPTTQLGCYSPQPRLTIDANPAIVVTGPGGVRGNTIGAGMALAVIGPQSNNPAGGGFGLRTYLTLVFVLLFEAGVAGAIGYRVWRSRSGGTDADDVPISAVLGGPRPYGADS